jgi:hypothetical protein
MYSGHQMRLMSTQTLTNIEPRILLLLLLTQHELFCAENISLYIFLNNWRSYWYIFYLPETHIKRQATRQDCLPSAQLAGYRGKMK